MFELKIANPDVSSGTVQVSWCVDQEVLKYLADHNVKDPQVVLVVSPDVSSGTEHYDSKEVRTVVPLKDMIAFVEFKYPGINKIWGFITVLSKKAAHNRYLAKRAGCYDTTILNFDASDWADWMSEGKVDTLHAQPLLVEVPKEVFAPEPPQWEKDWVNHFFHEKCVDQCHFRKRRLFAYSVQPIFMVFNMLFRLAVLLFSASLGVRGTTLKYLAHPLTYDMSDSFDMFRGGSIFIRHLPEDDEPFDPKSVKEFLSYVVRSFWLLPFMPIISVPLLVLLLLGKWTALAQLGSVLAIIISLITVVLVLFVFIGSGAALTVLQWLAKPFMAKEPNGYWYLDKEEMDLLVCNNQKEPLTVSRLPAKKRSLKLRFQDLKTKVCRPFAG